MPTRSRNLVDVAVMLPRADRDALRALARQNERSLSAEIRLLIAERLREEEDAQPEEGVTR